MITSKINQLTQNVIQFKKNKLIIKIKYFLLCLFLISKNYVTVQERQNDF